MVRVSAMPLCDVSMKTSKVRMWGTLVRGREVLRQWHASYMSF